MNQWLRHPRCQKQPFQDSSCRSSVERRIRAAATFSSRCATDDVPGMGTMTRERANSQAIATCMGVAPRRRATRASLLLSGATMSQQPSLTQSAHSVRQVLTAYSQVPHAGLLFILVFILNVVPAFAPPTWITLSFLGMSMPHVPVGALALIGATAATLGRVTLAKLSRAIVRGRLLDEPTRKNIGAIKDVLEKRRVFAFGTFLVDRL